MCRTSTQASERLFKLHGGVLCLDFTNTADWHLAAEPDELLLTYSDLVAWGRQTGAVSGSTAGRLVEAAAVAPRRPAAALRRAIEFREALFRIFRAHIDGRPPEPADLEMLNECLSEAMAHARVRPDGDAFIWTWPDARTEVDLDRVIWPVARSAADLLTSGDLERVRICADALCGWLFLDTSRNGQRRWCSMDDCGNRNKARRFYLRTKAR